MFNTFTQRMGSTGKLAFIPDSPIIPTLFPPLQALLLRNLNVLQGLLTGYETALITLHNKQTTHYLHFCQGVEF